MIVTTTDLDDIQLFKRGKVRDVYELDGELLLIATDRISAFDSGFSVGWNSNPSACKLDNKQRENGNISQDRTLVFC